MLCSLQIKYNPTLPCYVFCQYRPIYVTQQIFTLSPNELFCDVYVSMEKLAWCNTKKSSENVGWIFKIYFDETIEIICKFFQCGILM